MAGVPGRSGGHNRKSVTNLKLEGTFRGDRHANSEIQNPAKADAEFYQQGTHLSPAQIHEYVSQHLYELGVSEDRDGPHVTALCMCYEILQDATEAYREDKNSKLGNKSAWNVILDCQKEIRMILTQFRAGPGERAPQQADSGMSKLDSLMEFKRH